MTLTPEQQARLPIDIVQQFPVGKRFLVYCQDGMSKTWGRWSAIVRSLDLDGEEITLNISQDWHGADTRGGQYWVESKTIKFKDFIIPIVEERNDF